MRAGDEAAEAKPVAAAKAAPRPSPQPNKRKRRPLSAEAAGRRGSREGNGRRGAEAVSARAVTSDDDVLTSPSIRRRAREAGVDLSEITGSGPEGRITQGDFDAYVASPRETAAKSPLRPAHAVSDGDVEEIKVIGVRRVIAQRLSESKRNIPHFAYVEEIDITELEALRVHLNAEATRRAHVSAVPRAWRSFVHCPNFHSAIRTTTPTRGVLLRHRACISALRRRRPTD